MRAARLADPAAASKSHPAEASRHFASSANQFTTTAISRG
jgi:hypothetical protein